jgi:fermentation-respiration switch protein FrsA (DUF1100 family)
MGADQLKSVVPSWLITTGTYAFGLVGVVCALLYKFQDNLLYHPQIPNQPHKLSEMPKEYRDPKSFAGVPFENVLMKTSDGETISMWLMLQRTNPHTRPTIIYFHGNAGNMAFRLPHSTDMYKQCGMNILVMDYRGFGDSTGVPNEVGLERDADATLKFALNHPQLQGSPIVLLGESLGGAVAVSLAHRNPDLVKAVILENTFLSISKMADVLMPFLTYIPFIKYLVLRIGWDSSQRVPDLKCAVLFVSGDSDELVPPSHMKQLYELTTSASFKDFKSVSGGKHNDTFYVAHTQWHKWVVDFLVRAGITTASGTAVVQEGSSDVRKPGLAIPTMQKNFQVK